MFFFIVTIVFFVCAYVTYAKARKSVILTDKIRFYEMSSFFFLAPPVFTVFGVVLMVGKENAGQYGSELWILAALCIGVSGLTRLRIRKLSRYVITGKNLSLEQIGSL